MFDNKTTTTDNLIIKPDPTTKRNQAVISRPVKLYKNAEELVGIPFRDLGEVFGESCQSRVKDAPPSISTARKRMLNRAANMKANVVLLHQCQIQAGASGCYRQAICQGSALNVSAK